MPRRTEREAVAEQAEASLAATRESRHRSGADRGPVMVSGSAQLGAPPACGNSAVVRLPRLSSGMLFRRARNAYLRLRWVPPAPVPAPTRQLPDW